ncbi:F-box/FBD/LRR-repeat protein At1g13570-like [Rutidosis leptorrhynchoides]|uniref:F-box/FBD/LRR-repeat protein At1g13570-like n=1 Tax=Rutidosis leptorrhynchoides TaxID=125765 RepID=UPI003A996117
MVKCVMRIKLYDLTYYIAALWSTIPFESNIKMKIQCLHSDRISRLPQNIIECLLILMPIRDAVRTSILSKKWRYCWTSMPKLAFHDKMIEVQSDLIHKKEYTIVSAIFNVLFLHTGPILEFEYVGEIRMDYGFDQILLYLWKNKIVKKWFKSLKSLSLLCVKVSSAVLRRFLSDCPLLMDVILEIIQDDSEGEKKFTCMDLIKCVPLLRTLDILDSYMEVLRKLTTLFHVRLFRLLILLLVFG